MDSVALSVSSFVHRAEALNVPLLRSKTVVLAVAMGIPVAVLLHDTSNYWMPTTWQIPIVSWFCRKWRQNPEEKRAHLTLARNAIIFIFVALALNEGTYYQTPVDYVADRVTSSTARKSLNEHIRGSRQAAFAAAGDLVGEEGLNEANVRQQRDTALRRRFVHDSRAEH
ncbi:uncharacterized protein TM35_000042460 [Trypanosoma theileri]|uniref:Uncharacterized protein n=1 Tax=Trypanosoma theileri TaxID=67003 RepID=A0A1X0P529_9TRYP|nr:uncharacterized protein TM35_000042460 [Trypanosoma theileri]ORC92032.1 hypothetical protein TM35_000042460 [Trypanosoma theileri]